MLKYRRNRLYKALSIILAVAMLLASLIGMTPAYALEGEQPTAANVHGELPLGTSEVVQPSGVSDSGTPPAMPASLSEALASPADSFPLGISPLGEGDTPPEFAEGYPKEHEPTHPGSKYVKMTIKPLEEEVTAYYIAVEHNATAPTKEQVRAGKDSSNNPPIKFGSQTEIRLNGYNLAIGPLPDSDTVYDFWVVLENAAGILSAPKLVELSTPKKLLLEGYPKVGAVQPAGSKQVGVLAYALGSATAYYVAVVNKAAAPTHWQIKQGWDGSTDEIPGNPALVAGSVELEGDALTSVMVTLPADATDYDVYMVFNKTYYGGGFIEDIWSEVVKLDVKTPAPSKIIAASSSFELETALDQAEDGDIIKLTASFMYMKNIDLKAAITIKGKNITLDMNGQDLAIHNPSKSGTGLRLERPATNERNASQLHMIGSGNLKIYAPSVGLSVEASKFTSASTVNVEILGGAGAGIGGTIAEVDIQNGSVTGHNGISASYNSSITVKGPIKSTGDYGIRLSPSKMYDEDTGCVVRVGSVEGANCGIFMDGGEVTVDGTIAAPTYIQFKDAEPTTIDDYLLKTTQPGYRTYQHRTAGTVWVKGEASSDKVCAIGAVQYDTLGGALDAAKSGETTTITLLQSITHNEPVEINGKSITFALGDFDLTIDASAISNSTGLWVLGDGKVGCTGSGKLHVMGSDKGVRASGGSELHISGNVTARQYAVMAGSASGTGTPKVTVDGDVTVTGQDVNAGSEIEAVSVGGYATITIGGNVTANRTDEMQLVTAVYSNASTITIEKNVTTQGSGVNAQNGGNVTIGGALHYNPTGSGDQAYIKVGYPVVAKTADDFESISIKPEYKEYKNGDNIVWVKEAPAICTIGAQRFTSLDAAIASVPAGCRATITLLQSITHTKHIRVEKKTINLDLMDYDLLLDTSADGSYSPALMVIDGGKLNLIGSGTGKFNIKSHMTAISAVGVDTEATVHNVVAGDSTGVNMVGTGDYLDSNSTVTVLGSITVGNGNGVEVNAKNGEVVVGGNITAGRIGVEIASNPGTVVTVNGDIIVDGFAAMAGIRAYGETTVAVTGNVTVRGNNPESNCVGVHASGSTIKVNGNVVSTGKGAQSDANGKVEIVGSLTAGTPFIVVGTTEMTTNQGIETDGIIRYTYDGNTVQIGSAGISAPTYTVTVQNDGHGTGSASLPSAEAGTEIILTATPSSGYRFKEWQVISGGVTIVNNKFNMPAENVLVRAIFETIPVTNHTVTFILNGGNRTGGGELAQTVPNGGSAIAPTVTRSGYTFSGWDKAFTNVTQSLTVTATWSYNGGGGGTGGSSGSSSDGNSNIVITPPAQDKPNTPTQAEIKIEGKVDTSGNLTVAITDKNITDAINKAIAEAKKNGNEANGVTLVLNVSTGGKTVHNVTVNLPKTVQDTIINKKVVSTIVVVDNPNIKINMDLSAIKEINKQANADVNVTATRVDSGKLTGNAKTAIGSRPVFDLQVNYGSGKAVQSFGAGSVSVTLPYTLGADEKAGNVQAVYVDASGKVQWLVSSVYDSVNKVLRFSTNHFSTYGVGYKQDAPSFSDIDGHWAKDDITFVVSRGLFSGTSKTTFSPNTAMTRGMFVTALGRLANADVSTYKQSSFADVKNDAYYMGYIEWASKNSIVNGTGNGKFAPDKSITREQMAVIMQNYAKAIGFTLPKVHAENTFADSAKISAYAKDAVKQMQMAGVINGKNGNLFDPQGTATRAEVSAVLHRFVELAISSDTMQGWTMNDSGKWMYYENGKPVTGKKNIDGSTYTFDQYGVTADVPKNLWYTTYTVQKGDSFWLIAHKLGCTMGELEQLNNKSRFSLIHPGDVLRVPEK